MPDHGPFAQLLLQFSPDALIVVDSKSIIRYANKTTGTLFGYSQQDLIGKSLDLLVPERFHLRHAAHVSSYNKSPSSREMGVRIANLLARRADGTEFPAGIRLAPFQSDNESYVAAAVRDMTERREIIDALVDAREEADRANRAKSRFLATASHDLRQPLQTVRMLNASMLKLTEEQPQLRDLVSRQETAINGASRLLNALLDISRLESGAIEPVEAAVPLLSVYSELRQEFSGIAEQKKLVFDLPESSKTITTDRILFLQLLQNLVGNAFKYTESGFVRVAEVLDPEALILTVSDSGVGIPEEKLDRIFDEYYQVGPQGTQRLGVGLGLAIVREISRILGYSVSVFSILGQGTQVQIRVPVKRLVRTVEQRPPSIVEPAPAATETARCRIILLEDNDSVRNATELFLSLEGYETRSAASVEEAAPLLSSMGSGDILVADYHLEGDITGLDVLQQLRSRQHRDVPAVLLSGDLPSMMRTVKSPIANVHFLSKPVDTKALLQAIAELSE
jgi:two-component system, sensor histidine kinase